MWKPDQAEKEKLAQLYSECSTTVDRLPYTDDFELIYGQIDNQFLSKHEVFVALTNMRKRKELPRKAR